MNRLWVCASLAGCTFGSPDPGAPADGGPSDTGDAPDARPVDCSGGVGYGADPFAVCLPSAPAGSVMTNMNATHVFDTDACTSTIAALSPGQKVAQTQAGAPMLCVFSAGTLDITGTATIRAQGALPLVLLSHGDLHIGKDVIIDVSGASSGAASNAAVCTPSNGGNGATGGGGGAGGSFQTLGGDGTTVVGGGTGGMAAQAAIPTFLRGGCAGGKGGNEAGNSTGGLGGRGGGAVYLLARVQLRFDGKINASGGGGLATTEDGRGGGGGGGSGGMIALWAGTQLRIGANAELWANGGGGGGGSDAGNLGGDGGVSTDPATRGTGGSEGASGATGGGNGAIGTEVGANGAGGADKSGGGGGGGVGWIENVGPGGAIATGMFSPPAR